MSSCRRGLLSPFGRPGADSDLHARSRDSAGGRAGKLLHLQRTLHAERLMNEQRYVRRCRELLRYHQGLYLYLCDGTSRYHVLTEENVENYKRVLKINGFTARYKENVRQEILQFYYASP